MSKTIIVTFREEAQIGARIGKPKTAYHGVRCIDADYVEPEGTKAARIIVRLKTTRSQVGDAYQSVGAEFNHTLWLGFLNPEVELSRLMDMDWVKDREQAERVLLDQESDLKTCLWALGHDKELLKAGEVPLVVPDAFINREGALFYEGAVPKVIDPQDVKDWTRAFQTWVDPDKIEKALAGELPPPKLFNATKDARKQAQATTASTGTVGKPAGGGLGTTVAKTPGNGLGSAALSSAPAPEKPAEGQVKASLSGLGLG